MNLNLPIPRESAFFKSPQIDFIEFFVDLASFRSRGLTKKKPVINLEVYKENL